MDAEKLIILVQANECLYNKNSPGYRNQEKKRMIWKQISVEMEYPEELCQKRWSCLRDRYAKEKRQENLPSGSGAKFASQWPLMQTMEFIAPYIVPRPMRCSYNICKEYDSQSSSDSPLPVTSILYDQSPVSESSPLPDALADTSFAPTLSSPTTPAVSKRRRQAESTDDQHFSRALDAFTKLCEKKSEKNKEDDTLTCFGKMIVSTIRSMSHTKQKLAMQRVTSLVMQMSLEPDE